MTGGTTRERGHIVVTGGAGFLGTNLCDALAARGEDVVILDNLSRPRVDENCVWLRDRHPKRIRVIAADVRDADAVNGAVRGAAGVIHLAAQVAVTTSVADPVTDFEINARGTLNVLEAVRRCAPEAALLFASTNKVYGKLIGDDGFVQQGERYVPRDPAAASGFDESTPLSFYSPYGCSKGVADQYIVDYARIYGLRSAVFRMSCLYGPHQYGNEDQGWVAHFLISAVSGAPISIYGDGHQLRDVLYVTDAVQAYLFALDDIDAACGRVFNLGGGAQNALSLRECLRQIRELTGTPLQVSYHAWRPGDQLWYVSKTDALRDAFGWQAEVGVADGLRRLHGWVLRAFGNTAVAARKLAS